jgi:hypothetical protein
VLSLPFKRYYGSLPGVNRSERHVDHSLHLQPWLRLSGVVLLLPFYAFMACTGQFCLCLTCSIFV